MTKKTLSERRNEVTNRENAVTDREQDLLIRERKLSDREVALNSLSSRVEVREAVLAQKEYDFNMKCASIRQQVISNSISLLVGQLNKTKPSIPHVETFDDFNQFPNEQRELRS